MLGSKETDGLISASGGRELTSLMTEGFQVEATSHKVCLAELRDLLTSM